MKIKNIYKVGADHDYIILLDADMKYWIIKKATDKITGFYDKEQFNIEKQNLGIEDLNFTEEF